MGVKVSGQFGDGDDRKRFGGLRGLRDMASRAPAMTDFYGGPVWKAHRQAAHATRIDSDNVLLLHPAKPSSGFSLADRERPGVGANGTRKDLIVATIYYFDGPVDARFV